MRAGTALRNGAQTLVEHAVDDRSQGAVLSQPHHGQLPIVIAGHEKKSVAVIHRQMVAAHAVDLSGIHLLQGTVFLDPEGNDALVSDGIQYLSVMRRHNVRRVCHFDLFPPFKKPLFHIYIENRDALRFSRVRIGSNICNILFLRHTVPPR